MKLNVQKFATTVGFCSIITITTLSVVTKINHLNQYSFDFDEIYSVVSSYSSYSSMLLGIRYDPGNPPLYFMLLKFWRSLFGEGETTIRSLSVLFHFLTLAVIVWLSRKKLSITSTICVFALLAGSGTIFYFSRYARAYALVLLLSVTVFHLLTSWVRQNRFFSLRLIILYVTSVLGLYSHYSFTIFYGELLFILFAYAIPSRQSVRRLTLFTLILGWIYLPWVAFFIQNQISPAFDWQKYGFGQLTDDWIGIIGWTNVLTNNVFGAVIPLRHQMVLSYAWILLINVILVTTLIKNFRTPWKRYALSFSLLSINLILFTPLHRLLTDIRYSLYILPFLFLSLGITVDTLPHKSLRIGAVIIFITANILSYPFYDKGPPEDWRGLAHSVPHNAKQIILFHPCHFGFAFRYYFRDAIPSYCLYENPEKMYLDIWNGSLSNTIFIAIRPHTKDARVDGIINKLRFAFSEQRIDFGSIELITLRKQMSF